VNIIPLGRLVGKDRGSPEPVLMITPPSVFLLDERVFMSLGILKVAAVLERAGHEVELLDLSGIENYLDVVDEYAKKSHSRVVALTTTTPQLPAAVKVAERVRAVRPDMKIIIGGPHVTLVHSAVKLEKKAGRTGRAHAALERLLQHFDVLVSGDGEAAVFAALKSDAPRIIDGDDPRGGLFMTDVSYDASPYPARHLVDVSSYNYTIDGEKATSLIAQLGCPFGCGFSVTGDALIFTDKGFERMDSLASGEYEVEKCEHGGSVHVHRVNRKVATVDGRSIAATAVYEGKRPTFEVRTTNGLRVRGTEEHPFLVARDGVADWCELRDLKPGDWLVMKSPDYDWPTLNVPLEAATPRQIPPGGFNRKESVVPTELNEDLAWLTGYLIGDGCLPADGRPSVHVCVTGRVRERLESVIRDSFGVALSVKHSSVTDRMDHGWIHSRAVYEFFVQSMGISPRNKLRVPDSVVRSPKSVVISFLNGLWDADGYDDGKGLGGYLTTVSYDLAREVANLILMLGDAPYIHEIPSQEGHQTCYRVGRTKLDRIPSAKALYRSSKSGRWYWRTPRNANSFLGVRRSTLIESGLPHPLNKAGQFYTQVRSITPGLVEDIYDLRVPDGHNFVANGIVVHNCGGRNSKSLRMIRTRTTQSIVREIAMLHRNYGFRGFMLYDDELNVNPSIVELMNALSDLQSEVGAEFRLRGFVKSELFTDEQAAAMYRAGFRWLLCGFEAASPRILQNINKKATIDDNTRVLEIARRHGLKVKALMSVGHPGESEETVTAVHDWLLQVKPDDFDCTVITTYPGTPYYDEAIEHPTLEDVWTYTCKKSGDRLHAYDVDFTKVAEYYKGDPNGGYHSYVFTDHLSGENLVNMRNWVENSVREKLSIPFNPGKAAMRYEHSMGQSDLPHFILRRSPPMEAAVAE
jgi:radical SAM superfamily enzyme YgiQ (UPF0313 family)